MAKSTARGKDLSRREVLRRVLGVGLCLPLARSRIMPLLMAQEQHLGPAPPPAPTSLSPEDDQFLEEVEKANVLYFGNNPIHKPVW